MIKSNYFMSNALRAVAKIRSQLAVQYNKIYRNDVLLNIGDTKNLKRVTPRESCS